MTLAQVMMMIFEYAPEAFTDYNTVAGALNSHAPSADKAAAIGSTVTQFAAHVAAAVSAQSASTPTPPAS